MTINVTVTYFDISRPGFIQNKMVIICFIRPNPMSQLIIIHTHNRISCSANLNCCPINRGAFFYPVQDRPLIRARDHFPVYVIYPAGGNSAYFFKGSGRQVQCTAFTFRIQVRNIYIYASDWSGYLQPGSGE